MDPPLYFRRVLLGWIAGTSGLALLGAIPWRDSWWGFHALAFLPVGVAASTGALFLAAAALAGYPRFLEQRPPPRPVPLPTFLLTSLFLAAAGAAFWFARAGHTLLGDGSTIVTDLPRSLPFHPWLAPANFAEHEWYRAVRGWFQGSPTEVVQQSLALGTAVCGVAFAGIALALSRALWGSARGAAWLAAGVILAQGYVQLFAGYIEHYSLFVVMLSLYLLAAVRFLQGRWPLWPAAVAFLLTLAAHPSGTIFAPGFLLLAILGWRAGRRRSVVIGAAMLVGSFAALNTLLAWLLPGYSLLAGFAELSRITAHTSGDLAHLLGPIHLRDFVNGQHLIGPLGGLFLIAALVPLLRVKEARTPVTVFLGATALVCLAASFATTALRRGSARDWDVFAAPGVTYTVAALAVMAAAIPREKARTVLAAAWLFSLGHTVAWVGLNHSETRSVERFAHLPLGPGGDDVVLGNRLLRQGDFPGAATCFRRALETSPADNNAHYLLGVTLAAIDSLEAATGELEQAVALRPDRVDYRMTAAELEARVGRPGRAAEHLAAVCDRDPERCNAWLRLAERLRASGREDAADSTLARGVEHFQNPGLEGRERMHALENAGRLEVARNRLEPALACYREVLEKDPGSETALTWTASLLMQLGRPDEARVYIASYFDRHPDHEAGGGIRAWRAAPARVESDSIRR